MAMLLYDFPTIDQCVDFLISQGCEWDYEKEQILQEKRKYKFNEYLVIYDPYEIFDVNPY
jgi:hypothetical protein